MHARILPRVPPGKRNSGFCTGRGASPDCRWRLARALLASRVARASCPWTRAKAHGRDAHATCATDNREMCPTGRVEDKGRQAAGSRLFSKPAGNSPEIRNTVGR